MAKMGVKETRTRTWKFGLKIGSQKKKEVEACQ